ncbi:hypothetical protein HanXRQr2_Chr09g0386131 [Helianthus annuus]|uniref:Uncharacterized protein n=1 Tax=Helianthus annuus TaxID=4232 RepID=A0A9K3N846_HELAN|nr:hypothetical protein HanXRQr2_Chr09g0386131 [Helianthus annuus]
MKVICVLPSSFEERDLDICGHKETQRTFKAPRPYIHERIVCHFGKIESTHHLLQR